MWYKGGEELQDEIRKSMFIVLPSAWYENNPHSAIECFALGKPVIGARVGGIPELIRDGETRLAFKLGWVLKNKTQRLFSLNLPLLSL